MSVPIDFLLDGTKIPFLYEWKDLYAYMSVYGIHIVIGALLSAVTIYRREMSCNRVFHEDEDDLSDEEDDDDDGGAARRNTTDTATAAGVVNATPVVDEATLLRLREKLEAETDELLEGAGMYCSAQPIVSLLYTLFLTLDGQADEEKRRQDQPPNGHRTNHNQQQQQQQRQQSFYHYQEGEPHLHSNMIRGQEHVTPSDLLEHAGNYCSGEPLVAALALFLLHKSKEKQSKQTTGNMTTMMNGNTSETTDGLTSLLNAIPNVSLDPLASALPLELHVHVASFLHPKDVLSLSCVSKSYQHIVNPKDIHGKKPTNAAIWRTLFFRDYAWLVTRWDVGREALDRSNIQDLATVMMDKEFYFKFQLSYIDYILAGQNTTQRCLVGLHSHIYDLTNFLDRHPGSPDTLMVHAGKDATRYFEDMGHSMGARRLAKSMCVVADASCYHQDGGCNIDGTTTDCVKTNRKNITHWSICPTPNTRLLPPRTTEATTSSSSSSSSSSTHQRILHCAGDNLLWGRKQQRNGGKTTSSLSSSSYRGKVHCIEKQFYKERQVVLKKAIRNHESDPNVLGPINVYFDPFMKRWYVWYTNIDLQNVHFVA